MAEPPLDYSTATKHAEDLAAIKAEPSLDYSTATEHAEDLAAVKVDRENNSMENLWSVLCKFLTRALHQACQCPRHLWSCQCPTGTCQCPMHLWNCQCPMHLWNCQCPTLGECENAAGAKIEEWAKDSGEKSQYYHEETLLKHKEMFDIMIRHKDGSPKEDTFLPWCRKIDALREEAPTPLPTPLGPWACAHSEDPPWFKILALDLLTYDVAPEQKSMQEWQIQRNTTTGEIKVTNYQRKRLKVILRKHLGHAKVAYFIFHHGIPELFKQRQTEPPNKAVLQSLLEDGMRWHASMLQSIVDQETHPHMSEARKLGAFNQGVWRMQRRVKQKEAWNRHHLGRQLAMGKGRQNRGKEGRQNRRKRNRGKRNRGKTRQRGRQNRGKRKSEEMSATEQQILQDFRHGKTWSTCVEARAKRMPPFRGEFNLSPSSNTTPH